MSHPVDSASPTSLQQDLLRARFDSQRRAFAAERYPSLHVRLDRLSRLLHLLESNEARIIEAISADFGNRSAHETRFAELFFVCSGIRHARAHLARWMRPKHIPTQLHFLPARNRLLPQPLGVAGIISPWNFPLALSLGPAIAALAAGNRVLLKPSEHTPDYSALLAGLVRSAFAADELDVIVGGADTGRQFASLPFDHLFFTGSTAIGREVALAAAANLTPVTLELGGKSPVILDESCDMQAAAGNIAFGKLLTAGQVCIAPDYLLVPAGKADAVAEYLVAASSKLYPSLLDNPDYTAIINPAHRLRLTRMVQEARAAGARVIEINPAQERFDAHSRKFPPTLVLDAPENIRLMREEIFGPVLPIVEYADTADAIARINRGDRPLALYWFGSNAANRERILRETHAGGVTINDCLWHIAQESQPFGGVGASGMGAYHGEWGFRTFSKEKPVFYQPRLNGALLLRPPYGKTFEWLMKLLKRIA